MPETLQERIKRALASEPSLDFTISDAPSDTVCVAIRDKQRDRGREMAEKMVREKCRNASVYPDAGEIVDPTADYNFMPLPRRTVAYARTYIAAAINTSNAELIREVLAVLEQYGYGCDRPALRAAIAAPSPETKI